MNRPVDSPIEAAAATGAMIAGLRRRLCDPRLLEHPLVVSELRKLDVQLDRQMSNGECSHGRHRSATGRQVEDVSGYDLKPDPLSATTAAEFMAAVRQYRSWNGEPSLRRMATRAGQVVVHSTMHTAMQGDALPKLEVVKAIIIGCEGTQEDLRSFVTAWRRLASGHGREPTSLLPAS